MLSLNPQNASRSPSLASVNNSRMCPTAGSGRRLGVIAGGLVLLGFLSGGGVRAAETPVAIAPGVIVTQVSADSPTQSPERAQLAPANVSDESTGENSPTEAPSVVWLIAMPAVPILGGAFIYLSRRLLGQPNGECRLVTQAPLPEPTDVESLALEVEETDPPTAP
ncbi:hypothetical protein [Leptolyngbya iicbica]|uniref:Uncharacterized protein n=2 Tax=Cyanophyceae TaxID=3028117 RepID=A0A4Q7E263_9CYAN|nr:hypothetical protein [Leptolyngbya sp. LK]RZM75257.1 hypothetical protein DYY88_21750 [Leptolyngbya sp. LK]